MRFRRHLPWVIFVLLGTATLCGCAKVGAPVPPELELPKPPNDLRATRKGDKVYLTWSVPTATTERATVRHQGATQICRSLEVAMSACGTPVGEVAASQFPVPAGKHKAANPPPKVQASYTDTLPLDLQQKNPVEQVTYAVSVLNTSKRSAGLSNQVKMPVAPTLPPPDDFKAQVTPGGVVLSWTGILHEHEAPELRHIYRVYRRQEGGNTDTVAGEVSLSTSALGELVDHSFEWEKTYDYRATVVTLISQRSGPELQVEGDDTAPVKVFVHDVYPPAVPSGLQAVFSGVGQAPFVDLIWAPVTDADLAGYNVYRHEEGGSPLKINAELVKSPAFRDANVVSGHSYVYSVSAVDLRNNESAKSEEASEAVP
ncbi:MAG: hypothetical protein LAN63_13030 [Acidobacteriia bacterium]|nr:hypothetical protein [Terriglobia bacterium]